MTYEHTKKITYNNIYFISGLMNKHLKLKESSVNTKIRLICTKKNKFVIISEYGHHSDY